MTKTKQWGKAILGLLLFTITAQAETKENKHHKNTIADNSPVVLTTYQSMSTEQLQKEVEKHSQKGSLSFALGKELMKRWSSL